MTSLIIHVLNIYEITYNSPTNEMKSIYDIKDSSRIKYFRNHLPSPRAGP